MRHPRYAETVWLQVEGIEDQCLGRHGIEGWLDDEGAWHWFDPETSFTWEDSQDPEVWIHATPEVDCVLSGSGSIFPLAKVVHQARPLAMVEQAWKDQARARKRGR